MIYERAVDVDRAGELERAASLYEEALAGGTAPLEIRINLAVLYWQATDFGMIAAKRLSPVFLQRSSTRMFAILDDAQRTYPASSAPKFWKRYIAWADLGEALDSDFCDDLLLADPACLEPAMHVFTQSQGKRRAAEAQQLLARAKLAGTARGRYVASVLESAMRSASSRR